MREIFPKFCFQRTIATLDNTRFEIVVRYHIKLCFQVFELRLKRVVDKFTSLFRLQFINNDIHHFSWRDVLCLSSQLAKDNLYCEQTFCVDGNDDESVFEDCKLLVQKPVGDLLAGNLFSFPLHHLSKCIDTIVAVRFTNIKIGFHLFGFKDYLI